MKFCPECNTEYTDEAISCSDCGLLLVDSLPTPAPMNECDNCGGVVDLDSDFCPQCGTLFAEDQYSCTNHPTGIATGVCVICQQLFCADCLSLRNKKYLCAAHAEVEIREEWALVFKSVDFYTAQIIRGKLESAGITVNPTNNTNPGFMADGMIESAIGRTLLRYPIKIFVPFGEYLEALTIVNDGSSDGEIEHN